MRAVLPQETQVHVVGGAVPQASIDWMQAGATGFGEGSALYAANLSLSEIVARASGL
jgi:2-dehydro-3-deoxyphosphogalactonate aldolase